MPTDLKAVWAELPEALAGATPEEVLACHSILTGEALEFSGPCDSLKSAEDPDELRLEKLVLNASRIERVLKGLAFDGDARTESVQLEAQRLFADCH